MREPIESEYFNWLCAKVLNPGTRSYRTLMRILYKTEFVWVVPEDGNRAADGVELRTYFLRETVNEPDIFWQREPCSVLEMMISFANRASFQTDTPVRDWFWKFMENLQLDQFRQTNDDDVRMIERTLHTFIWRTYDSKGFGGMFPMRWTQHDQRNIEIWYQFCEYLDHEGLI